MQVGDWVEVQRTKKQGPVLHMLHLRDPDTGERGERAVVLIRCTLTGTDRIDVKALYDPADLIVVPTNARSQ